VETGTLDELRFLLRNTMTVVTERPIEGLESLKGVFEIRREEQNVSFQVESSEIGAILNHINGFGVRKLECTPPSLEELFMRHYSTETADGGE
jgi:ABC-2 type transport system ATP-binding protein